jgi:hypothetical protein
MQTINSKELLRDCYGLARQQKKGSCWLDSTLEVFLNADTIGELVRSEMFEYGLYNDKVVPYKVNPDIIEDDKYRSFLIYIMFNFILFNLEITNIEGFIKKTASDKIILHRQASYERCETSLEHFMGLIQHILYKSKSKIFKSFEPKIDEKIESGGFTSSFCELLFKYIPQINTYIKYNIFYPPFNKEVFNKKTFLGASFSIKVGKHSGHATSAIKCNNDIFYYDNNMPININTLKRNINIAEDVRPDGEIIRRSDFLDNFWEKQADFIIHYCDYFNHPNKPFGYTRKISTTSDRMFQYIITYNKKKDYTKDINVKLLNSDKDASLKNILYNNFIETANIIINTKFTDDAIKTVLKKIVNLFCEYLLFEKPYSETDIHPIPESIIEETNEIIKIIGDDIQTLPTEDATLYKYLKYKHKYLSLLKKSNIL